jgi:hypothetical protein
MINRLQTHVSKLNMYLDLFPISERKDQTTTRHCYEIKENPILVVL